MKEEERFEFMRDRGSIAIAQVASERIMRFENESWSRREVRHERSARLTLEIRTKTGGKIVAAAGQKRAPLEVSIARVVGNHRTASVWSHDLVARFTPNQPPEPTVMSVTPRADARVAPATTVAHL